MHIRSVCFAGVILDDMAHVAEFFITEVFRSLEVGLSYQTQAAQLPLRMRTDQKARQAFWSVSQSRVLSPMRGILGTVFLIC